MSARRRWILWFILMAGAAGLVLLDRQEPQGGAIVDAAPRRAAGQQTAKAPAGAPRNRDEAPMILAIRPRTDPSKVDDVFAARDWRPPPPPAPKPAPAPPPVAPPLPYTVFGKKLEDGVWQVFLRRDDRIVVVKTLDTIDNVYRVDQIRPPVMILTYLPLQQRQSLQIGGAE